MRCAYLWLGLALASSRVAFLAKMRLLYCSASKREAFRARRKVSFVRLRSNCSFCAAGVAAAAVRAVAAAVETGLIQAAAGAVVVAVADGGRSAAAV
jgi:hypothetical protein